MRSATLPLFGELVHEGARRLASALDASVNVIDARGFESRYVRRTAERAVLYVSSQTGCAQGCTMCWLTAQGLTRAEDADEADLVRQLRHGLAELDAASDRGVPPPSELHVDLMARGDPLASRLLPGALPVLARHLQAAAWVRDATPRILISTILPRVARRVDLVGLVRSAEHEGVQTDVYWSWYSSDPAFRRRRMPAADESALGFERLVTLSHATGRPIRVHLALIPGENDSEYDAHVLCSELLTRGARARVNLIRYNPPPGESPSTVTADEAAARAAAYEAVLRGSTAIVHVKRITPVGCDVAASCGMFVADAGRVRSEET